MSVLVHEIGSLQTPESLVEQLQGEAGVVLLRSESFDSLQARYSFVTARPFLTFRSFGSRCHVDCDSSNEMNQTLFGNPWQVLDELISRYELLESVDLPFPLGGCFGYWGYELKNFVEPRLARRTIHDLDVPDCQVGLYDSLVVFDHRLAKTWIVSTGLELDGSRSERRRRAGFDYWRSRLEAEADPPKPIVSGPDQPIRVSSNLSRSEFLERVVRAQSYIRSGDIYQVNLSQRLAARHALSGWEVFQRLSAASPAPFSAYLDAGGFQLASSSPELFLRLSGRQALTRPIKGTRPRAAGPIRDAQLMYELQTDAKELAELVMITDLLRNDLGKVCAFGSVQVPELARLERYPHVQHLVSTVEGQLRPELTHLAALAACFPGGSITGAPKIRAMEIIDELEPVARGPYTGALGYLGFNRESQLSIIIRTALCCGGTTFFQVGAGIVADSVPSAEYAETLTKAGGFCQALQSPGLTEVMPEDRFESAHADGSIGPAALPG